VVWKPIVRPSQCEHPKLALPSRPRRRTVLDRYAASGRVAVAGGSLLFSQLLLGETVGFALGLLLGPPAGFRGSLLDSHQLLGDVRPSEPSTRAGRPPTSHHKEWGEPASEEPPG
jgi:hypothetical protein